MTEDPFDVENLRLDLATLPASSVPIKIQKRRQQFIRLPLWWLEKLGEAPLATGSTHQVAGHLIYLDWKNHGKPFKLPNGMLKYDGICRQSKWRALNDLERRGLITLERRQRKSPIIRLILVA
jgi:hypothetical protein